MPRPPFEVQPLEEILEAARKLRSLVKRAEFLVDSMKLLRAKQVKMTPRAAKTAALNVLDKWIERGIEDLEETRSKMLASGIPMAAGPSKAVGDDGVTGSNRKRLKSPKKKES